MELNPHVTRYGFNLITIAANHNGRSGGPATRPALRIAVQESPVLLVHETLYCVVTRARRHGGKSRRLHTRPRRKSPAGCFKGLRSSGSKGHLTVIILSVFMNKIQDKRQEQTNLPEALRVLLYR